MAKVDEQTKAMILAELELVKKIKQEFNEKGTKMYIMLRRKECLGINKATKGYLLRWAKEADSWMVDTDNNVVPRKE